MTRAILFDADGVVIAPHPYFSTRLNDEFGIPLEKILPFFKKEFKMCTVGKADLKEEVAQYFPAWGWDKSVDELLRIWFSGGPKVNEDVAAIVDELRSKGIACYLASDNEKYRASYIMNEMGLRKRFDEVFFSCNLGFTKSNPQFYDHVLAELALKPSEVMYWDDDAENIEVAKAKGIDARVYHDAALLRTALKDFLVT